MRDGRPALLFHCQHSLGLGHLVRSFALCAAFAEHFRVTSLCGGELPANLPVPPGIDVVGLPPIAAATSGELVSRGGTSPERAFDLRRDRILEAFRRTRPAVIV